MSDEEFVPEQPGAFRIELSKVNPETNAWFIYRCPCGCGSPGQLSLIQPMNAEHDKHTWNWDGNCTTPTLAPSIRRNVECKFHGHMQKGIWTACSDGPPIHKKVWRPEKSPHVAIRGKKPENVIVDDPVNQPASPEMEKLMADMESEPALTAHEILHGERLPPPEFDVLLATIERETVEGTSTTPPKMYLVFGEHADMATDYAREHGIEPALCRYISKPEDMHDVGPEQFDIVVLAGWDTDRRKRQCYIALKRNLRWREYFKQHQELP